MSRTTYLIHFDRPLGDLSNPRGQATRYIGSSTDLARRLSEHASGRGARIVAAAVAAGISWQLARCWPGGYATERRLKRRHRIADACPLCSPQRRRNRARRRFQFTP